MHFGIKSAKIKKILAHANYIRTPELSIKYLADEHYYYTVVVPKKLGNAVKRNKVKRVIREIMRRNSDINPNGYYIIYFNQQCDQLNRQFLLNNLKDIIKKVSQKRTS